MPTASQAQAKMNAPSEPRAAKVKRKAPLDTGLKKLKGKDIGAMSGTEREKLQEQLAREVASEMKEQQRQDAAADALAIAAPQPRALDAGGADAPAAPSIPATSTSSSEDADLRREVEEEDAAVAEEERDLEVMDTGAGSAIAGALGSIGLESGLGSDDGPSKVYDEKTGMYVDKEQDSGISILAENGEKGDDEKSVGLGYKDGNVTASQKGLLQDKDGNDLIGSLSVGKDGVEAEGIHLADGWGLDFKAGPDEQKVGFSAPQELTFPPPDGFEVDFIDLAFPVFPGVSFEVESGVEGGLTLGGLNGVFLHKNTKEGDDPYQQVSHWELAGGGEISSEIGVFLKVSLVGGVPSIIALKTGLQADAKAEAKLGATLKGSLDFTSTVPVAGEKPKHLSTDGALKIELDGGGSVGASFGAFVSVEVLTFEQELWSIDFIKVPIADLDVGGSTGVEYKNGKYTFEKWKPAYGKYGADFDWLFKSYFKARKLDKAKAKATDTKAESKNIKELKKKAMEKQGADGQPLSVKELLADPANDTLIVNAEVQRLMNEEEKLVALDYADRNSLAKLEERIEKLTKQNEETKKKRWALTNFIRGDIKELTKAKDAKKTLEKNLARYDRDLAALGPKMEAARAKFRDGLEGKDVEALIVTAREKKHEARRENYALYLSELESGKEEYEKNAKEADKLIGELETKRADLDTRIAGFTSGDGKGDVALHERKEKELKAAKDAAEKPYLDVKSELEESGKRVTTLEAEQKKKDEEKGHTGFFGFFKKAFSGGDSPELKQARGDVTQLKKQEKKLGKAYDKAASTYETHVAANPITALNRQLSQVADELKQRKKGRMRLENRWLDKQRELRLIMLGEFGKEMSEEKQQEKMAKYAQQYGEKKDEQPKVA